MNADDENYELMIEKRTVYMEEVRREAADKNVPISQWEKEEIEMAFEHGFAHGFVAGYQSLRQQVRSERH